jgi:tetratricopeptide (TPR) repeat protein
MQKSIAINPNYSFGYLVIGNIFFNQKEYDSAMLNFRKAIRLDPANQRAYTFLSVCFVLKKEPDSSILILNQLINKKIADASALKVALLISNYYQDKKSFDKEIGITRLFYDYDSVYHIPGIDSSQKAILLNNLAFAYLFNGQANQSKYYYTKAGALSYFYYNTACIASLHKKTSEALQNLETSFQNGYNDFNHIQEDTDLDNIRNTEEFKQLLKKYFPGKAK